MSQLKELAKREQMKLARNVYELAMYYSPQSRVPDLMDFQHMYERVKAIKDTAPEQVAKSLWPIASDHFHSKLVTKITYATQNSNDAQALLATLPKEEQNGAEAQELYDYAVSNSRMGQMAANEPTSPSAA